MCLIVAGAAGLVAAVVYPWWLYNRSLFVAVLATTIACCAAAPVAFILGFAGYGSVAAALQDQEQSLRLCLASAADEL